MQAVEEVQQPAFEEAYKAAIEAKDEKKADEARAEGGGGVHETAKVGRPSAQLRCCGAAQSRLLSASTPSAHIPTCSVCRLASLAPLSQLVAEFTANVVARACAMLDEQLQVGAELWPVPLDPAVVACFCTRQVLHGGPAMHWTRARAVPVCAAPSDLSLGILARRGQPGLSQSMRLLPISRCNQTRALVQLSC